jgi:hypothetical protein
MLERDIEKRVCEYARARGCEAEKFKSPNRGAVPDRLFTAPGERVWFCEFKAPGKKPTPQQQRDHDRRRAMGFRVYVIDDVDEGKRMVDAEMTTRTNLVKCSISGSLGIGFREVYVDQSDYVDAEMVR